MKFKSDFLNILQNRGFLHQCSNLEELDSKLCDGTQSAYIGFDATAKSLHAGSLLQIMMLYWFQQCGHRPITLMGGGTSKIGDPSFKDESRKLLSYDNILANIEGIKSIFAQFLTYGDGASDAQMVNNNDWLDELNYLEFLRDYGRHFTVNRMLSFDSVKTRLERESPLTLLEFNYMVMQGYDFVELHKRYGTILQMGGSDQWGNIINGVELGRKAHRFDLFALTCPLLTTASGKKMGKTEGGAVWVNADMLSPYEYYQYWRNTEDADVGRFLKLFTTLPLEEISKLETLEGQEINDAKKILAFEATKLCHGEDAANDAEKTAADVFEKGGVGDDLPSFDIPSGELAAGIPVLDLYIKAGLAASKGEARKLVQGGGARVNDEKVDDPALTVNDEALSADGYIKLSAGKKRHALIRAA